MQIGQKIIHLESVDSTNKSIANLHKRGKITHGTVILADEQFAGKGQRGSEWHVNPGENLTFSFLLKNVNLSVSQQFRLTQIVSLSLVDLLKKLKLSAQIKWPNDIYVQGKKIAGVLIENQVSSGIINSSIVGIGLNVNQRKFEGFEATSIALELDQALTIQEILFSFVHSFNARSIFITSQPKEQIKNEYLSFLLNFNKKTTYEDESGRFEGTITDVSETGRLEVMKGTTVHHYDLKEITLIS